MVTPAKKLEQRWLHAGEKLFGYGRCRKPQKEMKGLVQDLEYEKMYSGKVLSCVFGCFLSIFFPFPKAFGISEFSW